MKHIRTEIHVIVATYIGDDIDPSGGNPPLSRSANSIECVSLTRIAPAFPVTGEKPHVQASAHVEALLASAKEVLPSRVSHNVHNLHVTPSNP